MIGTRLLHASTKDGEIDVPVTLDSPTGSANSWSCGYSIGWPGKSRVFAAYGLDAVQATLVAMQMVGTELYSSDYHAKGLLRWGAPGDGYGFPVPSSIRDLLVGNDKKLFG